MIFRVQRTVWNSTKTPELGNLGDIVNDSNDLLPGRYQPYSHQTVARKACDSVIVQKSQLHNLQKEPTTHSLESCGGQLNRASYSDTPQIPRI